MPDADDHSSAPLGCSPTVGQRVLAPRMRVRFLPPQLRSSPSGEPRSLTSWQDFGLGSRAEVMLVETRRLQSGGPRTRSRDAGRSIPLLFVHVADDGLHPMRRSTP